MAQEALNAILVKGFIECWWPGVDDVVAYNWADGYDERDDGAAAVMNNALAKVDYSDGGPTRYAC